MVGKALVQNCTAATSPGHMWTTLGLPGISSFSEVPLVQHPALLGLLSRPHPPIMVFFHLLFSKYCVSQGEATNLPHSFPIQRQFHAIPGSRCHFGSGHNSKMVPTSGMAPPWLLYRKVETWYEGMKTWKGFMKGGWRSIAFLLFGFYHVLTHSGLILFQLICCYF